MRKRMLLAAVGLAITIALQPGAVRAQAGFEDDRVMLQGFYWESYRHGHPDKFPSYGSRHWYRIVGEQAPLIRQGRFDLIWLPPPSFAGAHSAGYNPKQYFNLGNSYGDLAEHARVPIPLVLAERRERHSRVALHEPQAQTALVHVQEHMVAVPEVPGGNGVRRAVRP